MANMKRRKVLLLVMAAFLSIPCAASATPCPRNSIPEAFLLDITPSKNSAFNTSLTTGHTDIYTTFWHTHLKIESQLTHQTKQSPGPSKPPAIGVKTKANPVIAPWFPESEVIGLVVTRRRVSDLRQSRRLEILSGSKPLGPSGDFCIDLISAIALISLSQHDLLSVRKRARFYGFSYSRHCERSRHYRMAPISIQTMRCEGAQSSDSLCQNTVSDSRNCQTLGVPRQSRGLT
jgi:hypothetical protein